MNIHNVYSDLMLALSAHVNSKSPIKIKNFQFNLANTSFQLNLSPQFELPSAIINLGSIVPFVNHPYVFQRVGMIDNKHQISALYDKTKDIELILQEEIYTVSIDININCESQIQALNIQHALINSIPLNKYLHLFKFVSFFEINSTSLQKFLFDINKDEIQNLFLRHNKYSDSIDYCFSNSYEPLVRLTNSSLDISSITSSSFQVSNSFEVLFHCPIFVTAPNINIASNGIPKSKELRYVDAQIGISPIPYVVLELQNKTTNKIMTQLYPVKEISSTGEFIIQTSIGDVSGLFKTKELHYKSQIEYFNKIFEIIIIQRQNYKTNEITYLIDGDFLGELKNVQIDSNVISGWFNGYIDGQLVHNRLSFIINSINELYSIQQIASNYIDYNLLTYSIINNTDNRIIDFILRLNKFAVKLKKEKSSISNILVFDKQLNQYQNIDLINPIYLENDMQTITFYYRSVNFSFHLSVDPDTYIISHNNLAPTDTIIDLIALNFNNLEFDYIENLHPGYVESVNIDLAYNNTGISAITPFLEYGSLLFQTTNLILDELNISYINNQYELIIVLDNLLAIDLDNLKYVFIINSQKLTWTDIPNITFVRHESSLAALKFLIPENLYFNFFNKVDKYNPLYCSFN